MAEAKQIPTITQVTILASNADILTYYDETDALPDMIQAFIASEDGSLGGVPYKQGELIIEVKNFPLAIIPALSSNGEFIITSDDAAKYSINSSGTLIYTE